MKRIVAGTSGHIDHGKTALVRALTGIDADRLKEEKERGITIDIGFADLTLGDTHLGLIDVPGHERFVRNMLAGAQGIDLVLLVVAADEGVMPQTREHFDICRLLDIKSGLIVITKMDLVDSELLEVVKSEVNDFVRDSFLEDARVLAVSSRTGQGIEELKNALVDISRETSTRDENAVARMPVDRVFTIKGFGTVVTGTLISGTIGIGDELDVMPSDQRRARVRGLQVHGSPVDKARAGERTAINLQGLELEDVHRGHVVAAAGRFNATSMIDVHLQLLKSAPRRLRSRASVRLHCGTAELRARVVLIGEGELQPGNSCYAQLRLETPSLILPHDRFIIRSSSPANTIGGGRVIDSLPRKFKSTTAIESQRLLEKLDQPDETERIAVLVEMSAEEGMSRAEIAARSGAPDAVIDRAVDELVKRQRAILVPGNSAGVISRAAFDSLSGRMQKHIGEHHRRNPLERGMAREELRKRAFVRAGTDIFRAVVNGAAARGTIIAEKDIVRLSTHRVELASDEKLTMAYIADVYRQAGLQPLPLEGTISDVSRKFRIDEPRVRSFVHMLITSGELVRITDLLFHRAALDLLRGSIEAFKTEHGSRIDVAAFKDLAGVSRKYAIPLLEYLDRLRITRRIGDLREIL